MPTAHYTGTVQVEWLADGRRMKSLADFGFVDAGGQSWSVPKGATIDGASIPRLLWPVVGSPYDGRYRNASVIHDWYCSIRTRPSDAVHAMFHEAMLASGVTPSKARIMYLAVLYAGPSWTDLDIANANLATGGRWAADDIVRHDGMLGFGVNTGFGHAPVPPTTAKPRQTVTRRRIDSATDVADFERVLALAAQADPSPDALKQLVEREAPPPRPVGPA